MSFLTKMVNQYFTKLNTKTIHTTLVKASTQNIANKEMMKRFLDYKTTVRAIR